MKDYKEMAQSVLKRRDEELARLSKKKTSTKAFIIPAASCAAAAVLTVTGIAAYKGGNIFKPVSSNNEATSTADLIEHVSSVSGEWADVSGNNEPTGGTVSSVKPNNSTTDAWTSAPGSEETGSEEIVALPGDGDMPWTIEDPFRRKPYDGQPDKIEFKNTDVFAFADRAFDEKYFEPHTLEELNNFYGVNLLTLSDKYADWEFSARPYGFYYEEGSGGGLYWRKELSSENMVCYSTDDKLITVRMQFGKFNIQPKQEVAEHDVPKEVITDEFGGQAVPAYSGTGELYVPEGIINGFEVKLWRAENGDMFADLDHYNCHVGLYAHNISEEEFLEDLRMFTE